MEKRYKRNFKRLKTIKSEQPCNHGTHGSDLAEYYIQAHGKSFFDKNNYDFYEGITMKNFINAARDLCKELLEKKL